VATAIKPVVAVARPVIEHGLVKGPLGREHERAPTAGAANVATAANEVVARSAAELVVTDVTVEAAVAEDVVDVDDTGSGGTAALHEKHEFSIQMYRSHAAILSLTSRYGPAGKS
jgi:hypothetical protein